jgi:chitin disaccharide deacetylase
MIIVNADDWGRSQSETDVALRCYREGRITSVSAMVFMEDSKRAAKLAKEEGIDVGLHLNLSQRFSGSFQDQKLKEYHDRIVRFLTLSKYNLLIYNPFLRKQFRYDYQAQVFEFTSLFGKPPSHIDGHQHMHLCTNILLDRVITPGQRVRRNFSFRPGEKSIVNRKYRQLVDLWLSGRYRLTDFFFALSQNLQVESLRRIAKLAEKASVEIMVHPTKANEYQWLMSEDGLSFLDKPEKRFN